MEKKINKYLTTKNVIFLIMTILFIVFLNRVSEIALMFFAAFIISAALVPLVDRLSKKMPRALATSIVLFAGLVITFVLIIPLVIFSFKQGVIAAHELPAFVKTLHAKYAHFKILNFDISSLYSTENIVYYINEIATKILNNSVNITKIIVGGIVAFITVALMVFYMCFDDAAINEWFVKLFPETAKEKAKNIFESIKKKSGGFIISQFTAMLFVGVLVFIGLLILKNPNALMLGFIAGIFDIVPVVGPTFATIIGLLTAIDNGIIHIILTLAVYLVAQILENQFLRPVIYGKFMNVHPLIIILSLLVGAKFLGFWGIVLGPAIASVICILIDELYIKPINGEDINTEKQEQE